MDIPNYGVSTGGNGPSNATPSSFLSTCLFTRLEESSLVPAGFPPTPIFAENVIYETFVFLGGNWLVLLFSAIAEER